MLTRLTIKHRDTEIDFLLLDEGRKTVISTADFSYVWDMILIEYFEPQLLRVFRNYRKKSIFKISDILSNNLLLKFKKLEEAYE